MNLYQIANHEQPYGGGLSVGVLALIPIDSLCRDRSEERRVGKECPV